MTTPEPATPAPGAAPTPRRSFLAGLAPICSPDTGVAPYRLMPDGSLVRPAWRRAEAATPPAPAPERGVPLAAVAFDVLGNRYVATTRTARPVPLPPRTPPPADRRV